VRASLEQANLTWTILRKADLSEADLSKARLNGVDFEGVLLSGTILPESTGYSLYSKAI
jgi:uncharacterized protein YjbI with pentapeptide repeats